MSEVRIIFLTIPIIMMQLLVCECVCFRTSKGVIYDRKLLLYSSSINWPQQFKVCARQDV